MRLNELFQVIIGLFLCLTMECGRTDHVHLKIHVPDVVHKHKHIKTKYVHVFHPKVVHTEHSSSIQYLHSRNDPIGNLKGSFSQPHTEYRISEEDFNKWRQLQQRKALEKRKRQQQQQQKQQQQDEDEYDENLDEEEETNYDDELYKKHRANKANSAALNSKKENKNHKNHNNSPDYDSSNTDKVYAKLPNVNNKKQRPNRPSKRTRPDELKQYQVYGITNVDAESSNVEQQYTNIDPTAIDPGYYSTLPRDVQNVPPANQDDIYSGLISKKYNKNIEDKSKLLADINYNRKQQTKNLLQRRRGQ